MSKRREADAKYIQNCINGIAAIAQMVRQNDEDIDDFYQMLVEEVSVFIIAKENKLKRAVCRKRKDDLQDEFEAIDNTVAPILDALIWKYLRDDAEYTEKELKARTHKRFLELLKLVQENYENILKEWWYNPSILNSIKEDERPQLNNLDLLQNLNAEKIAKKYLYASVLAAVTATAITLGLVSSMLPDGKNKDKKKQKPAASLKTLQQHAEHARDEQNPNAPSR